MKNLTDKQSTERRQAVTPTQKMIEAAEQALGSIDYMLAYGEWYEPQVRADNLRAALAAAKQEQQAEPVAPAVSTTGYASARVWMLLIWRLCDGHAPSVQMQATLGVATRTAGSAASGGVCADDSK